MDKKINMWNAINPNTYDSHMGHPDVGQLKMQTCVMKEQFEIIPQDERHSAKIAILGITNGNCRFVNDVLQKN